MPTTRIETRTGWLAGRHKDLIDAVQQALVAELSVAAGNHCIRLFELQPEWMAVPAGRAENYLIIEVSLYPGRSFEVKGRFYAALASHLAALGVAAADIKVILHEIVPQNWGLNGKPGNAQS